MKTIRKVLVMTFFLLAGCFLFIKEVKANEIKNIEMDVYINKNGDAIVTEKWQANLTQGTEGYRPYTNLEESTISNFTVTDDSGRKYESLSGWNVNLSFDEKAYKNGLHNVFGGVELCWGISKYGNREYTLKYVISKFITQYTDTQGIYFNFLNLDQYVGNAKIIIRSDIPFSLDNSKIWAFGNNGTINFEDGKIVLDSQGTLLSSQYMVALIRFETGLFNSSKESTLSFDDVYDSAMNGVSKDELESFEGDEHPVLAIIGGLVLLILSIAFNPAVWIVLLIIYSSRNPKRTTWLFGSGKRSGSLDFGLNGKILPSDDKINYFREIPCNKDLSRAYWVASQYTVVSTDTLRQGIIGAILLKWVKEGKIIVSKTKKGLFSFKDNNYAIDFSNIAIGTNEIENSLLDMLKQASGFNNILEAKEFEKWCKKNYSKIDIWFNSLNIKTQIELEKQGLITPEQEKTTGMFGRERIITIKKVNPQLREDAIKLKGLKKYLLDFSLMPEKEYFEVHMWEEYLIFAQLLGIADKVEEQFSKLYPKFSEVSNMNLDLTTIAIRNMVELGYKGTEIGRQRAIARSRSSHDYSGSSRSSGGGGSSYSSGGSSSSGSSGGGFR